MANDSYYFSLINFINQVHHHMERNNEENVEEIAMALLAENQNWDTLVLDAPLPGGDTRERVFSTLISSHQIERLVLPLGMEASSAEDMLRKAVQMPKLDQVGMALEMTESEAERILSILQMLPTLSCLAVCLGSTTDGIARPLMKHLRETSSFTSLTLSWNRFGVSGPVAVSQTAVTSICAGIAESRSLDSIYVLQPPVDEDTKFLAESLAGLGEERARAPVKRSNRKRRETSKFQVFGVMPAASSISEVRSCLPLSLTL